MLSLKRTLAPQPSTSRSRRVAISYDPVGDRIAYGAGKQVVIRSVSDPESSLLFTEHVQPVTGVAFAPSGHYVASADARGNAMIWSSTGDEIVTKGTYPITSGRINAIAWDFESKRIIAAGDGKERFGHAFMWDSGNSVGEISGHSSEINAVAIRPKRPLRAVTAGEDSNLVFYTGAPFKFSKTVGKHTRPISDVAYSPEGSYFASAGLDRKVALYNGTEGDFIEWLEVGHDSSVLALAWVSESVLATAGVDSSVRLFNIETKKSIATYQLPQTVDNQQNGLVATKSALLSVAMNGDIYYWSKDGSSDSPLKVVRGHQSAVRALASEQKQLYSSGQDGRVLEWKDGAASRLEGGHDGPIVGFIKSDGLISAGWDKSFKKLPDFKQVGTVHVQPLAVSGSSDLYASVSEALVESTNGDRLGLDRGHAVDVAPGGKLVAVGSGYVVGLYSVPGFKKEHLFDPVRADISFLKFSPDGAYLAAGDASGKIILYSVKDKEVVTSRWSFHSSRITSISWLPNSEKVVSGSVDTNVYVYSVKTPARNIKILNAHTDGVTQVDWVDDTTVVTGGADGSIKYWALP